MNESRLPDYLEHIRQAAMDACSFVEGQSKKDFLADRRTQQAVILSLLIIGEAATKLFQGYGDFLTAHPDVPWASMKGMRNRLAHGYFDINLDVVWDTAFHCASKFAGKAACGVESGPRDSRRQPLNSTLN